MANEGAFGDHRLMGEFAIRPGRVGDAAVILDLLDKAVSWLVEQGRTDQWGAHPASQNARFVERAEAWEAGDGLYVALVDGEPVGALVVGERMSYVSAADVSELYVQFLVVDRARKGHRIGTRLLEHAQKLAEAAEVDQLRVDCFRGPDRALVEYYRSQGFRLDEEFTVERTDQPDWPGQTLVKTIVPATCGLSSPL